MKHVFLVDIFLLMRLMVLLYLFETVNESERGRSSRPRGTFDAKHMDLPDLFDDEAIKERNRRVAEVNILYNTNNVYISNHVGYMPYISFVGGPVKKNRISA